jgi:hypothetical protein
MPDSLKTCQDSICNEPFLEYLRMRGTVGTIFRRGQLRRRLALTRYHGAPEVFEMLDLAAEACPDEKLKFPWDLATTLVEFDIYLDRLCNSLTVIPFRSFLHGTH